MNLRKAAKSLRNSAKKERRRSGPDSILVSAVLEILADRVEKKADEVAAAAGDQENDR